ncbi:MAG TPA: hypothetical protein VFP10_11630 [Candidatus Eisenbacteria bacterium]|nr:hypothetical protein [Candidatus Eisenbacteria bacterium]
MFDRIVVDEECIDWLTTHALTANFGEDVNAVFNDYALLLGELDKVGRVVRINYRDVLAQSKQAIDSIVQHDLASPEKWEAPIGSAVEAWNDVISFFRSIETTPLAGDGAVALAGIYYMHGYAPYQGSLKALREPHGRSILKEYLTHINFNIMLSRSTGAAILDWSDLAPLYAYKSRGAKPDDAAEGARSAQKLFEIFFPCPIRIRPEKFAKAMGDKRLEELRKLVAEAAAGRATFDPEFAIRTLTEILEAHRQSNVRQRIVGWASLPLDFVPGIPPGVTNVLQEVAGPLWTDRPLEKFSWYFFIADLVRS